ncbi:MAG: ribose 5-phosphate isomerase B [Chlorobi bacterium]|nr:MAG: ribose 5-phosphate isomerase B [Bacteroidota bacterium]MBE2265921.1 ribose 5-phosphate isomerase B [Flavobacteriales bacterium]MBL1160918.1 ribose 5-phosphate isomerase B [Chlorobiota bacterium]MBW7852879.1 ribose 5-phosphate isomerase B [Candidatus Kapabacteria bacterium]MCC6330890.1 ribose 5-phosphate isomerase B [Ignavibacteria bacterium]
MSISVGSDHAGFAYKEAIKKFLTEKGYTVLDAGTDSEASVDYPDYGRAAAELVANGTANAGIIVCGSGIGISIAANKVHGIRAANVTSVEMAKLARAHNNANMLAVGSRLSSLDDVLLMVAAFLETSFEGGRHAGRVAKLDAMG